MPLKSIRLFFLPIATLAAGLVLNALIPSPEATAGLYPEELPGAFTGGFGEETCHSCHFDYPLNPEEGKLEISGFPESYSPGETYIFSIKLSRQYLGQAGFQISSRFEDGNQAGIFDTQSERLQLTHVEGSIQYVQHKIDASTFTDGNSTTWEITWTAPESGTQTVVFNLAANAGNGDASAFGDFIFTRELKLESEAP